MAATSAIQVPSAEQIEKLQSLCEQTGQRYVRPRTFAQAEGRIRDLEIRVAGAVKQVEPDPIPRLLAHNRNGELGPLLRAIKRERYAYERRKNNLPERQARGWAARIRHMEDRANKLARKADAVGRQKDDQVSLDADRPAG